MTADQTAKGTIFYDTYVGNEVPVWDGTSMVPRTIGSDEISLILDATGHVSGSVYDVFAYSASGTLTLGSGPAWNSTTTRGTGAGTTELQLKNGIWSNKNAIVLRNNSVNTSSISANQATYLGTFYATANGQTGAAFKPTPASGGANPILGLYNAYNRVLVYSYNQDSTVSYTYRTVSWRASNGSNSNRVSFVDGLQQSHIYGMFTQLIQGTNQPAIGMDLDSTSNTPVGAATHANAGFFNVSIEENFTPQLGFHFVSAVEKAFASTTPCTFLSSAWSALVVGLEM